MSEEMIEVIKFICATIVIVYAIRNKKDGRYVFGFDYRYGYEKPHMRYIDKDNEKYFTPKLMSEIELQNGRYTTEIPKCCEIVKVEFKEVKENESTD